jgi:CubicO group peptidase (beta-lactamase class C family)
MQIMQKLRLEGDPAVTGVWSGWAEVYRERGLSRHFVQLEILHSGNSLVVIDADRESTQHKQIALRELSPGVWEGDYTRLWPFVVTLTLRSVDGHLEARFRGLGMTGREEWRAALTRNGASRPRPRQVSDGPSALNERVGAWLAAEDGSRVSTMTTSVFVEQCGETLVDEYAWGHRQEDLHIISSCTKSVTGLVTGIALSDAGLDAEGSIGRYLPSRDTAGWDSAGVTLAHVLDMSSGTEWDASGSFDDSLAMLASPDPVAYSLSRPSQHRPGTRYLYDNGLPGVAGEIAEAVTGLGFTDLVVERLLEPLGVEAYGFTPSPTGTLAAGGMFLRTRDMGKLGRLILQRGRWNDRTLVPDEWMTRVMASHTAPGEYAYSTYWHLNSAQFHFAGAPDAVLALGQGGQMIAAIPSLDAVVVITSLNWSLRGHTSRERIKGLLSEIIIPALTG